MLLSDLLRELVGERPVAPITEAQYARSIACFSRFLGRTAAVADLTVAHVNQWLKDLEQSAGVSAGTLLGRKRGLTPVWNYATELGLCRGYETRRLRRVRQPEPIVRPWSTTQIKQLLEACDSLPGRLRCGLYAKDLLRAVIWIGFETGLRPSDWTQVRFADVDMSAGRIAIVQHKTSKPHYAAIGPDTLVAIRKVELPVRERLVPLTKGGMRRWELKLFKHASKHTGFQRMKGQALGTIRKTHGTQVCIEHGLEAAAQSLGHVSGTRVARRHYVGTDALRRPIPRPRLSDDSGSAAGERSMRSTGRASA